MKLRYTDSSPSIHGFVAFVALCSVAAAALPVGCSTAERRNDGFDEGEAGAGGPGFTPTTDSGPGINDNDGEVGCRLFECQVVDCEAGPKTSISGTVYDPAGRIPLYNAIVYVPNTRDLPPITQGASCDRCGTLAIDPVASALTDVQGNFKLENVPVGDDIPVVVQIGKWRKEIRMNIEACKDNKLSEKLTLPKNQQEGSLPRIAASLGPEDSLVCLLRRFGVSDEEFTVPGESGAIHAYRGCTSGAKVQGQEPPKSKDALWDAPEHLAQYDIVLLACESSEANGDSNGVLTCGNKTPEAKGRMRDFVNAGGRVFATHYHYTWFRNGPDELKGVAEWGGTGAASVTAEMFRIDRSFPKGVAFGDWLEEQGASADGENIELRDFGSSIEAATEQSQRWIYGGGDNPVKYLSFNTPVTAEPAEQCGRVVISDLHVGNESDDDNLPESCGDKPLSPQEKALLFLLMDLSSCVQDDKLDPQVPN